MKKINMLVNFENNDEKNSLKLVVLLSIFFAFLPALLIYFVTPEKFSKASKNIIVILLNFEFSIFIAWFICSILPFIFGFLSSILSFCLWIFNLMVCLKILSSIENQKEIEIPDFYQFLKVEE